MLPSTENNYADAEPSAPTGPPDKDTAPEKEEKGDDQTAEIPKAVLGGGNPKPGDKCEFEVVQVMEDSVLVRYAKHGPATEPLPDHDDSDSDEPRRLTFAY